MEARIACALSWACGCTDMSTRKLKIKNSKNLCRSKRHNSLFNITRFHFPRVAIGVNPVPFPVENTDKGWWSEGLTEGKTARGASSPAKPALHMPEPLSITKAATSSSYKGRREGKREENGC